MSQVAFVLTLALIIFALRLDVKQSPHLSRSLWVPLIWTAVSASKPFTLWIHPNLAAITERQEYDYVQGDSTERMFLLFLICAGLIILYRKRDQWALRFKNNESLYIFYFYALMSIVWSDYPGVSAKRWIKTAGNIIIALIVLAEDERGEAIDHLIRRCAIILMPLSVLYVKYFPQIGIQYTVHEGTRMWVGVTTQKNSLGLLCAFMAIYLCWRLMRQWPKPDLLDGFLLALTLYMLYGAHSATSYIIFIVGAVMLILVTWLRKDQRILNRVVILTLLFFIIMISFFGQAVSNVFFAAAGRDPTFTGRMPLWTELIKRGSEKPLLGAGYGNFWLINMEDLWTNFRWHPVSGHNGYIDMFVDLGLVGLILLVVLIIQSYRKVVRSIDEKRPTQGLLLVFLVMIVLHNFTESSLGKGAHFLWLLFLLASIAQERSDVPLEAASE